MSLLQPSLDPQGREILNQTPIAFPVGFTRQEPLHLRIRRMVERYHQEMQERDDYESFADADDFDVEDGVPSWEDAPSTYEVEFMPPSQVAAKPEQATPAPEKAEPPKAEKAEETPKA